MCRLRSARPPAIGRIGILYPCGHGIQSRYGPASYVPNRHNLNQKCRNHACLRFVHDDGLLHFSHNRASVIGRRVADESNPDKATP
jgi:hypothetical protein